MFTVYVLKSEVSEKRYIGYSSNLEARLKSHNELSKKGWTMKYRPWRVIYTEVYASKTEAIRREKEMKTGKGREWLKANVAEY